MSLRIPISIEINLKQQNTPSKSIKCQPFFEVIFSFSTFGTEIDLSEENQALL